MLFGWLIGTAWSQTCINPMSSIYNSPNFTIITINNPDYTYIYNGTPPKVTNMTQSSNMSSQNFCTNNTNVFGSKPKSFCCTDKQTELIADQFFAKYVYGLYEAIGQGTQTLTTNYMSMLEKVCPLKPKTNLAHLNQEIAQKSNRSFQGVLYAVGKMALAAQPWAQTETCLICAPESLVSKYYSAGGNLSASQSSYDDMLSSLGAAVYDGINAQSSILETVSKEWSSNLNSSVKTTACENYMKAVPQNVYWCTSSKDCTVYMTNFWSNTAL
jgi:hypothetical protein